MSLRTEKLVFLVAMNTAIFYVMDLLVVRYPCTAQTAFSFGYVIGICYTFYGMFLASRKGER